MLKEHLALFINMRQCLKQHPISALDGQKTEICEKVFKFLKYQLNMFRGSKVTISLPSIKCEIMFMG